MKKIEGWHQPLYLLNAFTHELNEQLAAQIKILFEEKHLYQKVCVDPTPILTAVLAHAIDADATKAVIIRACSNNLVPNAGSPGRSIPSEGGTDIIITALLPLPNVRLFCTKCDERNVFRPVWYRDVSSELLRQPQRADGPFETTDDIHSNQVFFVALQCQHCKGLPEGFIIRRAGWKFSLEGRAPVEQIQVPAYVPKTEANLFRDALVARFTGKNLAAAYYLRAFIEQFARRLTGLRGVRKTGDEIMDAYAQTVPADKRSVLPSLKEWYDKLSEPLHLAEDEMAGKVFDDARSAIENHFEIRRALRMPEVHKEVDQQKV